MDQVFQLQEVVYMKHKIKYSLLTGRFDFPHGEGELTDEQIELLREAAHHLSCTAYYIIELENGSEFETPWTASDIFKISKENFNDYLKGKVK